MEQSGLGGYRSLRDTDSVQSLFANRIQGNKDNVRESWSTIDLEKRGGNGTWTAGRLFRIGGIIVLLLIIYGRLLFNSHVNYVRKSAVTFREGLCSRSPPTMFTSKYAVIIDAGSTGSRVHVYEFQFCGAALVHLVDEVFKQAKPGLSSFSHAPDKAIGTLSPLLKRAWRRVPRHLRRCTPVVLKATAGLRLLPKEQVDGILDRIRGWLGGQSFHLPTNPVSVIDGSEEAISAWISVNFLEKHIGPKPHEQLPFPSPSLNSSSATTWIVLEMGGGSAQIVFDQTGHNSTQYPEDIANVSFFGRKFSLYQHSYLGYGLIEARKKIKEAHVSRSGGGRFACLPLGHSESLNGTAELTGSSTGWDDCKDFVLETMFGKSAAVQCTHSKCSFNGIFQPALPDSAPIFALSYIYDRARDINLSPAGYTMLQLRQYGEQLCKMALDGSPHFLQNPDLCLDLVFIHSLLHDGYGVAEDRPIQSGFQIDGYETGWTLGSALSMVETAPTHCEL